MAKSFQFYKLFLDPDVREHVFEYDALAIIDWNVVIAHDKSFEELYARAFSSSSAFWVKGSHLAGSEDYDVAQLPEMWPVLDHLDGNAIYNNTDQGFVEYVNFTRSRWGMAYSWVFFLTCLVSAIDCQERNKAAIDACRPGSLFFHERVQDVIGRSSIVEPQSRSKGCRKACGVSHDGESLLHSVCDPTCWGGDTFAGSRFNGHGCGAGNPSKYGKACRLCFEDREAALVADKALAAEVKDPSAPDKHVIMCATKRPPEAIDCPRECSNDINTVCDNRCGSGRYGDWHCNWRNLGDKCRFCFRNVAAARLANEIAHNERGAVIMCDTHEPPPLDDETMGFKEGGTRDQNMTEVDDASSSVDSASTVDLASIVASAAASTSSDQPAAPVDSPGIKFPNNITPGQICVFIPGLFELFHETSVTLASVQKFMPGMRVAVSTHPLDFHVFHRALAQDPMVSVVNCTYPRYAALEADLSCGSKTELIYYMNPGEVLTRPFTAKDTHSPRGDLLVVYTDTEVIDRENGRRRPMPSMALLGFQSPSFTHEGDLILPVTVNAQLRAVLRKVSKGFHQEKKLVEHEHVNEDENVHLLYRVLDSTASDHLAEISFYIPERPDGIQFISSKQWKKQPSFPEISIWDVPLLKPRFGCRVDISSSLKGYDVATQLANLLSAFGNGARCDRGFIKLNPTAWKLKPEWEFPSDRLGWVMPSLRAYRVSVMYRSFHKDVDVFKIAFPTVIKNIRDALEVVVVVDEVDEKLFEEVIAPHRSSTPFPLRVITGTPLMDGDIQQTYSKLLADLYTEGDYVLHLDSDVIVFEEITYEHLFHLGKPVLPFLRYREDTPKGLKIASCWRNGTSHAIGEDVVHDFDMFNTHVYPRHVYPALREFIKERHGKSFSDFMLGRQGECPPFEVLSGWTLEERTSLLSDFNLLGAFLWYHMHDAVYWIAADPLDLQPDQWRPDLSQYAWVCQAKLRALPKDEAERAQYRADLLSVRSSDQCNSVVQYWRRRSSEKNL